MSSLDCQPSNQPDSSSQPTYPRTLPHPLAGLPPSPTLSMAPTLCPLNHIPQQQTVPEGLGPTIPSRAGVCSTQAKRRVGRQQLQCTPQYSIMLRPNLTLWGHFYSRMFLPLKKYSTIFRSIYANSRTGWEVLFLIKSKWKHYQKECKDKEIQTTPAGLSGVSGPAGGRTSPRRADLAAQNIRELAPDTEGSRAAMPDKQHVEGQVPGLWGGNRYSKPDEPREVQMREKAGASSA